jgi:glycerol kinase
MTIQQYLLAIDQGTTSTRAILFDRQGLPQGQAQRELPQIYPWDGWVEHDPEEIWQAVFDVCCKVISEPSGKANSVAAIGIANQRETTVIWERESGRPIHNAIVWQDRRTAEFCNGLVAEGYEELVRNKSGLVIDPYFSASKIVWLLDNLPGARQAAERGELAFGTIDSFLLWRLTSGRVHATDATNASRTMLFNIHTQDWDDELLTLFRIPRELLPEVRDNSSEFGITDSALFGAEIPITGMVGDQQAASVGQACLQPGMVKSTYGTGCFILQNIGEKPIVSQNRLVTTVAYRLKSKPTFALEGSIFSAGAAVQWLRDGLKIIEQVSASEAHTQSIPHTGGVYLVPAFTGLGAPYWDPSARGAILGLTLDSGVSQIVRAALESVCYQTRDLMTAMAKDRAVKPSALRVDGGMVRNDWLMQFLSDILDMPVERPMTTETTALGAAYLAGLRVGYYHSIYDISEHWKCDRVFQSSLGADERERLYTGWLDAVRRVRSFEK